jgi:hypothetical protein
MAKPWYRLAMIEHQKVGGGLQFFLADTTYHDMNQYIMGLGWTAVTGEDKNNNSYLL